MAKIISYRIGNPKPATSHGWMDYGMLYISKIVWDVYFRYVHCTCSPRSKSIV